MPTLRLFASAREAAGVARVDLEGSTVAEVLDEARRRYGEPFTAVLAASRVWVNGHPADEDTTVSGFDVVAVLPPVSGGAPTGAPPPLQVSVVPGGAHHRRPVLPPPAAAAPPESRPVEVTGHRRTGATAGDGAPVEVGAHRPVAAPPRLRLVPPPPPGPALALRPRPGTPPAPRPSPGGRALAPALFGAAPAEPAPAEATGVEPPAAPPRPGPPLAVVQKSSRPHGRLGLAWAAVLTAATAAGPGWLAAWLGMAAFVAASQTAMVWLARKERPLPAFAALTAAALPVAAMSGFPAMNVVVVVALMAALGARLAAPTKAPSRDVALTLAIGVAVGLAAASPVLLREINVHAPLFLLALAATYDAGAYLVGTGASSAWEGPAAGVAATIPVTMFAAIVLVPPFEGAAPILLGALGALLAPFGPVAGSALLGDATASAPALRRLDSLLVLGPLWAWCAAAFLL